MSIKNYGVIKGKVVSSTPGNDSFTHYQIIMENPNTSTHYQVDVNVRSKDQSEVLFYVNYSFQNEITNELTEIDFGYKPIESKANSLALDYIRGNLFSVSDMQPLGMEYPIKNDLNMKLDESIKKAQSTPDAVVYAFGQYFKDRGNRAKIDSESGLPSEGIHDVHMNQGNFPPHGENGIYQDGALLINYPSENLWVVYFLAFQTQSFQTDDNGEPIGPSWEEKHGGEVFENVD